MDSEVSAIDSHLANGAIVINESVFPLNLLVMGISKM
jgi:hypothetical protein